MLLIRLRYSKLTCSAHHRAVESAGPKSFGLDVAEVFKRRKYVDYVQKEIEVCPVFLIQPRRSSLTDPFREVRT